MYICIPPGFPLNHISPPAESAYCVTLLSFFFLGGGVAVAVWRVNSGYHLKGLCIIRKLETTRLVSEIHNQAAAICTGFNW